MVTYGKSVYTCAQDVREKLTAACWLRFKKVTQRITKLF